MKKKKLSAAAKRVAIAKDVLSQLKSEIYYARSGSYWRFPLCYDTARLLDQDSLVEASGHGDYCQVCGIGAAVMSAIRCFNKHRVSSVNGCDPRAAINVLSDYFSKRQMALIEAAFEPRSDSFRVADELEFNRDKLCERTEEFHTKHYNDTERMVAIFKNIVRNKGTFKI